MFLKFYDKTGRQLGHTSTTPASEKRDRQWGIKYFKNVARIVTQVKGKAVNTHIIITRS
mgnify:CR=1 FL=1